MLFFVDFTTKNGYPNTEPSHPNSASLARFGIVCQQMLGSSFLLYSSFKIPYRQLYLFNGAVLIEDRSQAHTNKPIYLTLFSQGKKAESSQLERKRTHTHTQKRIVHFVYFLLFSWAFILLRVLFSIIFASFFS